LKNKGFKEEKNDTSRVVRHRHIHDPGIQQEPETITKDPTPNRYHVFWTATTTEQYSPEPKVERWTTTFLVDRVGPKTAAEATLNSLGQCVAGLHDEPRAHN
jgi:hypothetical protein